LKNNNLFDLSGKVIVVTGACGLLGQNHCKAIAKAGGIPVILDLSKENTASFAREIAEEFSVDSTGYRIDISKEDQVKSNAMEIVRKYGRVDGLVNNAANNPKMESRDDKEFSRLENFPLENWLLDLSVGLTGAFLCAKHFGSKIASQTQGGVIVNISSDLGLIGPDQRLYEKDSCPIDQQPVKPITYSVIKSGMIGLTRYLATYWPERVRCNALCPGGVQAGQPEEFLAKLRKRIPLGRLAHPDEYGATLVYLLSNASSYVNGAVLSADGGRTVW
jgi:NAD(P)-dependent dehydrogenase (short-subunit alcohol dehydrogenase family)